MVGNIPGGNLIGGNFPGGSFPDTEENNAKNSQVYMHWHWSSSKKSSFYKPTAPVFISAPIIIFSYGAEIFPHLIGHVCALIVYIEM